MTFGTWALVATIAIHGGVAAAISTIPPSEKHEPTVITIREVKRKPPPPKPTPIEPVPQALAPQPKPAPVEQPKPAPKPKAAPPSPSPAPAAPPVVDTGFKMTNATGGGEGAALPRTPPPSKTEQPTPAAKPKTLDAPTPTGGCDEALIKPKPINVIQPAFTQDARDADITGKVRVEIAIDATGAVTGAKVIAGLGHGLDEAALEAARASTFSPATKCGVATATTFTIGMRFQ